MVDISSQLAIVDISALIIVVGTLILYFGKVIGDLQEEKYGKLDYYETGFRFIYLFVLFPSLLAYILVTLYKPDKLVFGILSIIIILFLIFYHRNLNEKMKIIRNLKQLQQYRKSILDNDWILLIFAFITIYDIFISVEFLNLNIFSIIMIILFSIGVFTYIAINYGLSMRRFPEVTVYTENDKIITGVLLSRGDFIELLEKDKITRVNADKVIYIEEISRDDTEK